LHELSLCRSIADLVLAAAAENGAERVVRITLEIGMAAPVEVEAVRFCLPLCLADTEAEGAELIIERPPVEMKCLSCGRVFGAPDRLATCPVCGGRGGEILAGREMRVVSIEAA